MPNHELLPNHRARSPKEIVSEKLYFDSAGYLFRAMSWIDYFERNDQFTALLYACVEARWGIEYLIFEEIVISTGANLSKEEYERCLKDPTKLNKELVRITPEYEQLQEFTKIIISLVPSFPELIQWKPKELMKSWGKISKYLHWCGSKDNTTELASWKSEASIKIKNVVNPIWVKLTSGKRGIMHPEDMYPEILEIWNQYKSGDVDADAEAVKIRMDILKPVLEAKYG